MRQLALTSLAVLTPLLALLGTTPWASAQDEESYTLVILALNCESDPGVVGMEPFPPDGCEMAGGGIGFTVTASNGEVLDGCTSDANGGCNTAVPFGAAVLVREDAAPAGYAPRENPVTVHTPGEPPAGEAPRATFVNVRQATNGGDPGDDSVRLPNTGAGTTVHPAQFDFLPYAAGGVLLAGIFAVALRQRARAVSVPRR
ncbi:MAG: SpaA isopeptide-forming pilin-related protein [Thermomicrobiales bacterium]